MGKYKILEDGKDFDLYDRRDQVKGTREKKFAIIYSKVMRKIRFGFFKYEKYNCSESCSEKLSYEIAKVLGIKCAKIEFAKDNAGTLGIINYFFTNNKYKLFDAKDFFNSLEVKREEYLTIPSIKTFLDKYDKHGFECFIEMIIFDALVGETDRHEENWGLLKAGKKYTFAPLYDNGANLLREFKDDNYAQKYYTGVKNFNAFLLNSKAFVYEQGTKKRYKHIELIRELYNLYPNVVKRKIKKLSRLTNGRIEIILDKLPDGIITEKHKEYIKIYLKEKKKILFGILERGEVAKNE